MFFLYIYMYISFYIYVYIYLYTTRCYYYMLIVCQQFIQMMVYAHANAYKVKILKFWTSLVVQWLRLRAPNAECMGSGKIPHATCMTKKKILTFFHK